MDTSWAKVGRALGSVKLDHFKDDKKVFLPYEKDATFWCTFRWDICKKSCLNLKEKNKYFFDLRLRFSIEAASSINL